MEKELYDWNQAKAYSIIALHNLSENGKELNYENFIREYDSLQTMYGKEGVIGLAKRYVEQ